MKPWLILAAMVVGGGLVTACSQDKDAKLSANKTAPVASEAELLYRKNCKVCHAQGINGAPILGNKKMWQPRLAKGVDALVENAVNGVGLMPAKGGKTHLSDEQIRTIVEFYLEKLNS